MKFYAIFAVGLWFCLVLTIQAGVTTTGQVLPGDLTVWTELTESFIGVVADGGVLIGGGTAISSKNTTLGYISGVTGVAAITDAGSEWNVSFDLNIGKDGNGELDVRNGALVASNMSYLGKGLGATGLAEVSGYGSKWTTNFDLHVGVAGTGTLNIADQGEVEVLGQTLVGCSEITPDGTGTIELNSGVLRTGGLIADFANLTGTGTIYANGIVSDIDLCFNSPSSVIQTITLNDLPQQNIEINIAPLETGDLGVGYKGNASLTIQNGVEIESRNGYLGYTCGATGNATVSGGNSRWEHDDSFSFYVGKSGTGNLQVLNGGSVYSGMSVVGKEAGSKGTVLVSGAGSFWSNSRGGIIVSGHVVGDEEEPATDIALTTGKGQLIVGDQGVGELYITNGGKVGVAGELTIDSNGDGDSFINMSDGGILSLRGEELHSMDEFWDRVTGTDAIRWWDASINAWAHLSTATQGVDYTLEYLSPGQDIGYTRLTVIAPGPSVPEPGMLALIVSVLMTLVGFPAFVRSHREY